MRYFCGIDIGSAAIKIVLIDESETIIDHKVCPTGNHYYRNAFDAFDALLEHENMNRQDLSHVISTGYGRKLFREADESISEITANAIGAKKLGETCSASMRTIINVGGQDSKIILLDNDGHVKNFVMNDKCAAGTGRFLEITARNLGLSLMDLGDCHLTAQDVPVTINSTCTVFAESEIISLLANGHGKGEILAGIHYSIAKRIARLAERMGIEDTVFFDGGGALNKGLVAALGHELMREVVVPGLPQITTALGAALFAKEAFNTRGEEVYD